MSILVKSSNNVLTFHCTIEDDYNLFLKELEELLEKPLFIQEGYYPKAFFDFGCRYLNDDELESLLEVLFVKKRVLFYGVNIKEGKSKYVKIYNGMIHAGDEVYVNNDTLFIYGLNKGGIIYSDCDLFFLGSVRGKIISHNPRIKIYGSHFERAQIQIMNHVLQDLTILASVMIYDNNEKIVINKEENIWQESL